MTSAEVPDTKIPLIHQWHAFEIMASHGTRVCTKATYIQHTGAEADPVAAKSML